MNQDISRNVLVTASSKGLGFEIANVFSDNGFGVIVHGRDGHKVDQACSRIKNSIFSIVGDLRDQTTIDKLSSAASMYNICTLVNNAAIPCYGLNLCKMSKDQILESLNTNLIAPINLIHSIYGTLSKNAPGAIININSIVGIEPKNLRSVHSATKWGLRGFSKSLRIEAKDDNIKVINVYPTRIKTVPEYDYGLDPRDVAERIYSEITKDTPGELVIDGRPDEFKPDEKYNA
jgi:short-subunit dehydrogenase